MDNDDNGNYIDDNGIGYGNDDIVNDDGGEGSTLLLHSSRRDCSGNVQQSVRALGIAIMIMIVILIMIHHEI